MTIENYNDKLRRSIVSDYDEMSILYDDENAEDEFISRLEKYYEDMKTKKDFKYKMGVLYSTFHIVKRYDIGEFSKDEEENNTDDAIYNVKNLDELIKLCDEDICNLYDLLVANSIFYDIDNVDRREYIKMIYHKRDEVLKVFPGFLIDIIYYGNTYDKNEILETYLDIRQMCNDEEEARKNTVSFVSEVLIQLKDEDYYNYKFLILEMIEDFYRYISYLIENNKIENEDYKKLLNLIDEDLDFFINIASNRIDLLNMVLSGFLNYLLLSEKTMDSINKYYDSGKVNKKYIKLLNESQKLKKIN